MLWCATLSLGSIAGVRQRKYAYAKTEKEAWSLLAKMRLQVANESATGMPEDLQHDLLNERLTMDQLFEAYMTIVVKPSLRPKTVRSYEQAIRLYVLPIIGALPVRLLNKLHVQSMINNLRLRGLSSSTLVSARAVLRQALNWAIDLELVDRNVAAGGRLVRIERPETPCLDLAQTKLLVAGRHQTRFGNFFAFAALTGMRLGELRGLKWQDVDLEQGLLKIERQVQDINGKAVECMPKTRRSRRIIPLPAALVSILQDERKRQEAKRAVAQTWSEAGYVFATGAGTPLDQSRLSKRLQQFLADLGLSRVTLHGLRHGAITILVRQGVDLRTIMAISGHTQVQTLMNVYAHAFYDDNANAMKAFAALFEGSSQHPTTACQRSP